MTRLISAVLLTTCMTGCAGREMRTARCEWPVEPAVSLDLQNPAQLRHLHDDAQAAEMLAVHYADSQQGHDKFGRHRQLTEQCEAMLFGSIARVHRVEPKQVSVALRRQNDTPF